MQIFSGTCQCYLTFKKSFSLSNRKKEEVLLFKGRCNIEIKQKLGKDWMKIQIFSGTCQSATRQQQQKKSRKILHCVNVTHFEKKVKIQLHINPNHVEYFQYVL